MLIKINGRNRFFGRLDSVTKVREGEFAVMRNGIAYKVEGGRHRGGTSCEWFVTGDGESTYFVNSLIAGLTIIDTL
jgi:hypothetical protein